MIEKKIEAFRYRLVGLLEMLLRALGTDDRANALLLANSRFECPVCRLIRVMRVKNRVITHRWARFCEACRKWPRRICRAVWQCDGVVFPLQIFQSQLAFLLSERAWLPLKIPIYLRKMTLLN